MLYCRHSLLLQFFVSQMAFHGAELWYKRANTLYQSCFNVEHQIVLSKVTFHGVLLVPEMALPFKMFAMWHQSV